MKIHQELTQGSDEWLQARCGMLTASVIGTIITPSKMQFAANVGSRQLVAELASQRITGYIEPYYISDDMMRGHVDEISARDIYSEEYAPVSEVGFITNDKWGFTLGYSPDGMVGDDGLIEVKSRRAKHHMETILNDEMPAEYMPQVQTGLLVSERTWCDFISYHAGLPMFTKRVYADYKYQQALVDSAGKFYESLDKTIKDYNDRLKSPAMRLIQTERNYEIGIIV